KRLAADARILRQIAPSPRRTRPNLPSLCSARLVILGAARSAESRDPARRKPSVFGKELPK
ncbi:hypothetical protein, partial [Collinsella aerofaciens]|uniref:hypothetical protein n=1 Tax=Collinsella aerofaciens TaxID=74426 RepID=UPI001EDC9E95